MSSPAAYVSSDTFTKPQRRHTHAHDAQAAATRPLYALAIAATCLHRDGYAGTRHGQICLG